MNSFHLLIYFNKTLQRLQADLLRQHNHNNQDCYCAEIVLLVYVPVSFFTFAKFLNFFYSLL